MNRQQLRSPRCPPSVRRRLIDVGHDGKVVAGPCPRRLQQFQVAASVVLLAAPHDDVLDGGAVGHEDEVLVGDGHLVGLARLTLQVRAYLQRRHRPGGLGVGLDLLARQRGGELFDERGALSWHETEVCLHHRLLRLLDRVCLGELRVDVHVPDGVDGPTAQGLREVHGGRDEGGLLRGLLLEALAVKDDDRGVRLPVLRERRDEHLAQRRRDHAILDLQLFQLLP
mmetsp:Transcript_10627/g.24193  ORF Transcript_10627/g.24193 Transcript_10627/m.24193 type:complete len:226 (+) Transcript_10627:65-742(+)